MAGSAAQSRSARLRRIEGQYPHHLQRALELEAAYTIVLTRRGRYNDAAWRRYIASFTPRALHGWIGRYLRTNPERRIL